MTTLTPEYFIGDIHGRCDLLEAVLEYIEKDATSRGFAPKVTFLGDLTDRGPDSKWAVELVWRTLQEWKGSTLLLGNHDEWFLEAIKTDGEFADAGSWIRHGGVQTCQSYGGFDLEVFGRISRDYPHHVDMLKQASMFVTRGPFIAVHAGINPKRPINQQRASDLNWIREGFLDHIDPNMGPIIHGHTIMEGKVPVVTENRISIDTGAFATHRLTVCILDPIKRELSFVQTSPAGIVGEVEPALYDRGYGTVFDRLDGLFDAWNAKVVGEATLAVPV